MRNDEEFYVYVTYGRWEDAYISNDRDEVLDFANDHVSQHLTDHLRHKDGFQVTEEEVKRFDVKIYKIDSESLDLPFQKWVDEYYANRRKVEIENQNREYEKYLKLKAKFEAAEAEPLLVWGGNMRVKSSGNVVNVQLWREEGKIVARLANDPNGYSPDAFEEM